MRADTILLAVCLIPVPLCDVPWNMENCEWFWPELSLINDIIFYIQHKQWTFFFCHAYVDLNRNCSWCITNPMPWSSCQQCLLQIISDSVPFSCLIFISKEPKMWYYAVLLQGFNAKWWLLLSTPQMLLNPRLPPADCFLLWSKWATIKSYKFTILSSFIQMECTFHLKDHSAETFIFTRDSAPPPPLVFLH